MRVLKVAALCVALVCALQQAEIAQWEAVLMISKMIFVAISLICCGNLARADSDTLEPITFASVQGDLKKSLSKMSVREELVPMGCLDGGKDKRTVCNFKIGKFATVMAELKKGEKDIVGITMICGTDNPNDFLKRRLAYAALTNATAPEMSADTRGKIFNVLTSGIEVGQEVSVN